MFNRKLMTILLALTFGLLSACVAPAPAGDSGTGDSGGATMGSPYAGETIEIIIPYGEGGGSDSWMRAIQPFLEKYLGDDVTVQAINMPGASGTLGANDFAAREADGLSMLVSSGSNALPYILGQSAVRYDFATFSGVLGSPVGGVVYVSPDLGITDVAGLCENADLIYGGLAATGLDMVPLLAFDLMGLDFQSILGYDGRGAARVAFEQGEINLDYQTSPAYLKNVVPLVEEGLAVPLFAFGVLDGGGNIATDPVFTDLPNVKEAIEICGGTTSGVEYDGFKASFTAGFAAQKNLWVHGDAPQERIDALSAAAEQVLADPEFQEVAGNLVGEYEFYAGADAVSTAFGAANNMSEDSFNWLVSFLNENYEAGLE